MAKNIRLGIKRLKEELNSEAFLSGLEAVINHSLGTGTEARFNVGYFPERGVFEYPAYVKLGDNERVIGTSRSRRSMKELEEFYRTLKGLGLKEGTDMDKVMIGYLEYPLSEDFLRKREIAESIDSERVEAISVHTHPGQRIVYPSEADLASLNAQRDTQRFIEGVAYVKETKSNPLGVIVPIIKSGREYRILMLQENSNVPFPLDTDFEELAHEFYELESNPENALRALMFPGKYPAIDAVKKRYNISHNYFNPSGKYWGRRLSMDGFLPIVK